MSHSRPTAAIIGAGVIGSGWAARFLLHGWDVRVYDPDPQASRKLSTVLDGARRALPGLYDEHLPSEGDLTFCAAIEDAVRDAQWIQESVSERLEAKIATIGAIQASAPSEAVLASSTSGFKPSQLAASARRPEQLIVAHPYNPVYLLPLVEVVPHTGTAQACLESAQSVLRRIGMNPVALNKEIDAHIGDRLLEALWREALWLVRDDFASTAQIDEIIRQSFGLRWAQMGLFETYRVAGGEGGMAHFIRQFAPALQWPWSRLTDVPELDDALATKIAAQSDEQSGAWSIRELEQQRDRNLVAILRALKKQRWGAGEHLAGQDQKLRADDPIDWHQPVQTVRCVVPLDWIDYNGHMNETHYQEVASRACDRTMRLVGCDDAYIEGGHSYFTVENILNHIDEAGAGERIEVRTQIIDGTGKRLHLYHWLRADDGRVLATSEQMLIHVSLRTRRATEPVEPLKGTLATAAGAQAALVRPQGLKAGKR